MLPSIRIHPRVGGQSPIILESLRMSSVKPLKKKKSEDNMLNKQG